MKKKILYIEWIDAFSTDEWCEKEELEEEELCFSVGWLIDENKKYITIATSVNGEDGCGYISIPKGCIIKKHRIR